MPQDEIASRFLFILMHELGHTLGLGDFPEESINNIPEEELNENPNLNESVMLYRPLPTDITEPHEAERAGVKILYYKPKEYHMEES